MTLATSRPALALLPALLLSACMGSSSTRGYSFYPVDYALELTSVERSVPGSRAVRLPVASSTTFADSLISVVWQPQSTQFEFELENRLDETIRIEWDGAAIVNAEGSTSRVMHKGVRFMDRNAPQPPSVVLRGTRLDELVAPADLVTYSTYSGWNSTPMLLPSGVFRSDSAAAHGRALANVGKNIMVLLPVEAAGRRHEYTFTFSVAEATVRPWK